MTVATELQAPVDAALLRRADEMEALDWGSLWRYLADLGLPADPDWAPRQFAGGYGNLNYLIRIAGRWAVLRRPPFGTIPKGANDMAREHRVLGVLAPAWALVPSSLHYCADPAVIGAHFLVTEFRAGLPLHGPRPLGPAMTAETARLLSGTQVDVLAHLHGLDVAAIGAGTLGKPDGFAARTLRGWTQRLDGAGGAPASARALFAWLNEARPADRRVCVIHNDFKLDNVVVDPETLEPRAVLDWDMATLGSPFFDLATLLSYWVQPTDPEALHAVNHTHSLAPGALSRRDVAERYLAATGFTSATDESDLRFFLALAFAKLGVVYLQLHGRFQADPENNRRYERFGAVVPGVFELGLAAAAGELL
ncbi:MAG: phosphotransferase family protein [Rhizobiaceae bacterium]|nr:phosphotransferase family protein [Rhizobiaceae bacterium]